MRGLKKGFNTEDTEAGAQSSEKVRFISNAMEGCAGLSWLDVLVEAKDVVGVVLFLEFDEAGIIGPVGCAN